MRGISAERGREARRGQLALLPRSQPCSAAQRVWVFGCRHHVRMRGCRDSRSQDSLTLGSELLDEAFDHVDGRSANTSFARAKLTEDDLLVLGFHGATSWKGAAGNLFNREVNPHARISLRRERGR